VTVGEGFLLIFTIRLLKIKYKLLNMRWIFNFLNPMKSYLNAYSVDSGIRVKSPNNMAMRIETHKNHIKSTNNYIFLKICMHNIECMNSPVLLP
jgi:hypothetical protein